MSLLLTPDKNDYLKLNSELIGNKIKVVPLNWAIHLDGLWGAQTEHKSESGNDEDIMFQHLPYGPFASKEEFQSTVENRILGATDGKTFAFAITLREKPETVIGFITYMRIYPAHRTCELGHVWLDPRYRRQNLFDEAVWLMTKHAIDVIGYRRVEWKCYAENLPSWKMALRNQFTFEGVHRNSAIVKGVGRSRAWFSIIDEPDEWASVKKIQEEKFSLEMK